MKFLITGDYNSESGLNEVFDAIHKTGYSKHFKEINYGNDINGICIILMCRAKNLNFKQRIRYSRKDKTIYMDIMLDIDEYINNSPEWRIKNTFLKISNEMPVILKKYSKQVNDFDMEKFITDSLNFLSEKLGFINKLSIN